MDALIADLSRWWNRLPLRRQEDIQQSVLALMIATYPAGIYLGLAQPLGWWQRAIWIVPMALWALGRIAFYQKISIIGVLVWGLISYAAFLLAREFMWGIWFFLACEVLFLFGVFGETPNASLEPVPTDIPPPTTFGSAEWGTLDDMLDHDLLGDEGLIVGVVPIQTGHRKLRYKGGVHMLTIAPTGSGKGTTAIIPNLLSYPASCLVIDPKGENALITAASRARMGHKVHIVDPWGIAREAGPAARFNPLDWLKVGDLEIGDNAMILADAMIVQDGKSEAFWLEEAKALLQGIILYVATDEREAGQRHLGRVRDLLMLDGEDMPALFQRMVQSPHHVVASTGSRSLQKDEKLLSNVLASAQSHTYFLDSAYLRESLSASDFGFEELKRAPTTIYLVLPADRLSAFGRWLRLLIQQAITVNARDVAHRPDLPVLFILDEMAALGRLDKVKEAYGLMRGFGLRMWGIVQNVGQLRELYGDSWQTFVSNSGVVTYQGSRDLDGAEYFSKLCGVATVANFTVSKSFSNSYGPGGAGSSSSHSSTHAYAKRNLVNPDELMRMSNRMQLVIMETHRPFIAGKVPWFEDPALQYLGRNLHLEGSAAHKALIENQRPLGQGQRDYSKIEAAF